MPNNSNPMFKNYLKIAIRNLWKHKVFSLINILGLSVGMAAGFLIFLYVNFELTYDHFHSKADRIYRMVTDVKTPSETIKADITTWAVAPVVGQEFPEVEAYTRTSGGSFLVRKGDIKFQESNTLFADSSLFRVFDFKLLKGNPSTALKEQLNIVLTEKTAKKYFGGSDPIGQTLLLSSEGLPAIVTGVMENIPENSQIKADMFVSMSTLTQRFSKNIDNEWGNFGASSYLLLKPGTQPAQLEKKFPAFLERHVGKLMAEMKMHYTLFLEPFKDVHLRSERASDDKGSMNNVYVFSAVALFILLIACINFVNLTTARSAERAREVGVRKVVGAPRSLLARQFIMESVLLCLLAFVVANVLVALLIPAFNTLSGKMISAGITAEWPFVGGLLVAAILIGALAGSYPAVVLSSFEPVVVLKGRFTTSLRGILLRKGLVTLQFGISIALIIATIVVFTQMDFMRNRDLGFSKDQMLVINTEGDPAQKAFKESLAGLAGIKSVTVSSSVPGGGNSSAYSNIQNSAGDMQAANLDVYFVDCNYLAQYGLKMAAGRSFSSEFGTDSTQAMIINEATAKLFGYSKPEDAIGRNFNQWGREGKIIGVIKDFHFRSLQESIKPLTMRMDVDRGDLVS
ncbi:MAG TPA: ABC transporter permease, partial [Dyadobacter sp.]|nr:ABC transporter permease [Dyadobacter sp.]